MILPGMDLILFSNKAITVFNCQIEIEVHLRKAEGQPWLLYQKGETFPTLKPISQIQ